MRGRLSQRVLGARRGQGLTENIITLALIAIATIVAITLFGSDLRNLFGVSSDALGGDPCAKRQRQMRVQGAAYEKNMQDFAQGGFVYAQEGGSGGDCGDEPARNLPPAAALGGGGSAPSPPPGGLPPASAFR